MPDQYLMAKQEPQMPNWEAEEVAQGRAKQLAQFLSPLLVLLDQVLDKRLGRTFLPMVQTIITFRDRANMRRWQMEEAFRYRKSELAFESPRLWQWEHRGKLLLLATLTSAFLLSLLIFPNVPVRLWLLRHFCHRTGQHCRTAHAPLYRFQQQAPSWRNRLGHLLCIHSGSHLLVWLRQGKEQVFASRAGETGITASSCIKLAEDQVVCAYPQLWTVPQLAFCLPASSPLPLPVLPTPLLPRMARAFLLLAPLFPSNSG